MAERRKGRRKRTGVSRLFEIIEVIVVAGIIFLLVHNFVAQPFEVAQTSMLPTLNAGEDVMVDKISPRWRPYERGEIIVFHLPPELGQPNMPYIKRIIGLPGDTISLLDGRVYVSSAGSTPAPLEEPYLARDELGRLLATQCLATDCPASWTVSEGQFFVLGDNRTASLDSRYFGTIEASTVIGRAWLRYVPLHRFGLIQQAQYPDLIARP